MKTLFFLLFATASFAQPSERLNVKNILDGFKPSGTPVKRTVAELEKLPLVKVGNNTLRMESEKQLIQVTGKIKVLKHEADGDVHAELQTDGMDSTIACEFPDPDLGKKSPYYAEFAKARKFILSKKTGDTVTLTGVRFSDKKHGKATKRIQNFLEIHPVLSAE